MERFRGKTGDDLIRDDDGDIVLHADAQATVEALQRENACKDTLIETLQAQLAQRGKDVGNE